MVKHITDARTTPFIKVSVDGRSISCILDSGSAVCLVRNDVLRELSNSVKLKRENITVPKIRDASGNSIKTHGFYYIKMNLGSKKCEMPCIVVSEHAGIKKPFLMGSNMLRNFQLHLNFETNKLSFPDGETLTLHFNNEHSVNILENTTNRKCKAKAFTKHETKIRAFSSVNMRCKLRNARNEYATFTPNGAFTKNLDVGLISVDCYGEFNMIFINDTPNDMQISKNVGLGFIEATDVFSDEGCNSIGSNNIGCKNVGSNNIGCKNVGSNNIGCKDVRCNSIGCNIIGSNNIGCKNVGSNNIGCKNVGSNNIGCKNVRCNNSGCNSIGCDSIGSNNIECNNIGCNSIGCKNIGCNNVERESTKCNDAKLSDIVEELKPYVPDGPHKMDILNILAKFRSAVALPGDPVGKTEVKVKLDLLPNSKPIALPAYRIPHSKELLLEKEIHRLLNEGIISSTTSAWAFPVILLSKPDGSVRMVVDYRKLNKVLMPDVYPLPKIEDLLVRLTGSKFFSKLDIFNAYYCLNMDEESRPLTAFRCRFGHFQFLRAPFGLCTLPSIFQRVMDQIYNNPRYKNNIATYLDDIIIYTKSIPRLLEVLNYVMSSTAKAGLRLKITKCQFICTETTYLGHRLSADGYAPLNEKTSCIRKYPVPTNVDAVRSFLGLMSYYRQYIPNFTKLALPLYRLLKKDMPFKWGQEEQTGFETLRYCLMSDPILVYPNFNDVFIVESDASNKGIGGVIAQKQEDGRLKPILFASRTLNKAEANYSTTDKEALALVWMLKRHRYLLYGYKIHCYTDHKPLLGVFANTLPEGRLGRWALTIQAYAVKFFYKEGKFNLISDSLSRYPIEAEESESYEDEVEVWTIEKIENKLLEHQETPMWSLDELITAQKTDEVFGPVYRNTEMGNPSGVPELRIFKQGDPDRKFELRAGILHLTCRHPYRPSELVLRVAIPDKLADRVIDSYHRYKCTGHLSGDELHRRLVDRYVIVGLKDKIARISCHKCNTSIRKNIRKTPLAKYPITASPMSEIHLDLMGPFGITPKRNLYVFAAIDRFTRYTILEAIRDRNAKTIADVIHRRIITEYGSPQVIVSDNAGEMVSDVVKGLCEIYQIRKCSVVSYHSAANGLIERANAKILSVLRKIISANQRDWDVVLPLVQIALNTSFHSSVGDNPHFLVYLNDKKLPFEIWSENVSYSCVNDYVVAMLNRRQHIYESVQKHLAEAAESFTSEYNKTARKSKIIEGSRIYLKRRTLNKNLKQKLAPIYDGPYRVLKDLKSGRYKITHIYSGREYVVHSDHCRLVQEPRVIDIQRAKEKSLDMSKANISVSNAAGLVPDDNGEQRRYNLRLRTTAAL